MQIVLIISCFICKVSLLLNVSPSYYLHDRCAGGADAALEQQVLIASCSRAEGQLTVG